MEKIARQFFSQLARVLSLLKILSEAQFGGCEDCALTAVPTIFLRFWARRIIARAAETMEACSHNHSPKVQTTYVRLC